MVAHHLGNAPRLQGAADLSHDNQRVKRRLYLANVIDHRDVAIFIADLVADDEAKTISPSAGRRIDVGEVLHPAYTYARSRTTLNAALDDFAGQIGGLLLAKFSTVFGCCCVRIFLVGAINDVAPDARIEICRRTFGDNAARITLKPVMPFVERIDEAFGAGR